MATTTLKFVWLFYVAFILIYWIGYTIFFRKKRDFTNCFITFLFTLYMLMVADVAFFPLPVSWEAGKSILHHNLVPFGYIRDFMMLVHNSPDSFSLGLNLLVKYVGLEMLMFMPFGFLLPIIKRKKISFGKTLFYSFLLSLTIELIQFSLSTFVYGFVYRTFDVDDLMLNTLGGIIGWLLFPIFSSTISSLFNLKFDETKN